MFASFGGKSHAVGMLLAKGASVSIAADDGITALLSSAKQGHIAVTKMLVKAGADLEVGLCDGGTPLFEAARNNNLGVMSVLIKAGANPDSRTLLGSTPMNVAAENGHVAAVKMLLGAKANPLLAMTDGSPGASRVPLDMAAQDGHSEVVSELIQQVGIEGCGGASGGVKALSLAAAHQQLDTMIALMNAGVVDTGSSLTNAAAHGCELSITYLLRQRKGDEGAYVNYRDIQGGTPLMCALGIGDSCVPSPRIVRLLVDAGADTSSVMRFEKLNGQVVINEAPLSLTIRILRAKKLHVLDGTRPTNAVEEELHKLEGIRRLLLRVRAVHALSLLWPVDVSSTFGAAEDMRGVVAASTPLRMMLPILRRRARRPRVLLCALWRLVLMMLLLMRFLP